MEAPDLLGRTPLHQAARCGNEAVVRLLLRRGADRKARDSHSRLAYDRARGGRYENVARLLQTYAVVPPSFLLQAATGVQGMVPRSKLSDPPPVDSKLLPPPPSQEEESVQRRLPSSSTTWPAARVEVRITEPVASKRGSGDDWDDPLPQIRYAAVALGGQDGQDDEKQENGQPKGKGLAASGSKPWEAEPFKTARYSVIEPGASKSVLVSTAAAGAADIHPGTEPADDPRAATVADWDEPFTALSYKGTPKETRSETSALPGRVADPSFVTELGNEASSSRADPPSAPRPTRRTTGRREMTSFERKVEEANRDRYYASGDYDRDLWHRD